MARRRVRTAHRVGTARRTRRPAYPSQVIGRRRVPPNIGRRRRLRDGRKRPEEVRDVGIYASRRRAPGVIG
jgi:hypothetical protein